MPGTVRQDILFKNSAVSPYQRIKKVNYSISKIIKFHLLIIKSFKDTFFIVHVKLLFPRLSRKKNLLTINSNIKEYEHIVIKIYKFLCEPKLALPSVFL